MLDLDSTKVSYFIVLFLGLQTPSSVIAEDDIQREWNLREKAVQEEVQKELSNTEPPIQLPTQEILPPPPIESVCFPIDKIEINGFALPSAQVLGQEYIGQCVGQKGIAVYLRALNKNILAQGYVTTRAVLPEQELSSGILKITIQEGRIEEVVFPNDYNQFWSLAVPMNKGDLLNIRDLEQGVDQLGRLGSQDIKFDIEPGNKPGLSRVIAKVNKSKPWSLGVSLDDGGSDSTGVNQASVDLTIYNGLFIQDMITISSSRDADQDSSAGIENKSLNMSIPFGYWTVNFNMTTSDNTQEVNGAVQSFISSGDSIDRKLGVDHVFFRDNSIKASWTMSLKTRERRSYINDTEVEVQRRNLTNIELGANYRHYIKSSVLDLSMGIQQGVDLLGAETVDVNAPSGAAQPDYRFYTVGSTLYHPFKVLDTTISLSSQFRFQWAETPLYSLDWFSNGGRYTVRGFASEDSLGAGHGWRLRNDFSTAIPSFPISLYFGWDVGAVSGQGAEGLSDKELMGLTLGSKGGMLGFQYDLFIAQPFILYGPTAKGKCCESGIRLSWRI